MPGQSLIETLISQAGALDALLVIGLAAAGWAIYRHSQNCKQSRKDLHDSVDANTKAVQEFKTEVSKSLGGVGERLSALEAVSDLKIVNAVKRASQD